MGIGLKLSRNAPIDSYRQVWRVADEAGFDHCWAFDHLVTADADGTDRSVFEGWTLLGAMAEATRRTRIGLLVSGMVFRHPALLAKAAVTVDHLSGGRLELGIGAGWAPLEHRMYGIDVSHRTGRLAEGLRVMELLWTEERADFEGRHYQLQEAVANPKPVQRPRPPLWIGAGGPTTLRIAAEHADVWNPAGDGLDEARAAGRQLIEACHQIGRDPGEIRWSAQFGFDGAGVDALLDELRVWHDAGFTELVITCSGADPARAAEAAAERVLPAARQLV
jgi:probable F420-dependent oxidoreductase